MYLFEELGELGRIRLVTPKVLNWNCKNFASIFNQNTNLGSKSINLRISTLQSCCRYRMNFQDKNPIQTKAKPGPNNLFYK